MCRRQCLIAHSLIQRHCRLCREYGRDRITTLHITRHQHFTISMTEPQRRIARHTIRVIIAYRYIDSRWEGLSQLPRWHHNRPHKNHHTALVNRFDRLRARLELAHIPTASLLVAQTVHLHTLHQYINFITKNRQLRCASTGSSLL